MSLDHENGDIVDRLLAADEFLKRGAESLLDGHGSLVAVPVKDVIDASTAELFRFPTQGRGKPVAVQHEEIARFERDPFAMVCRPRIQSQRQARGQLQRFDAARGSSPPPGRRMSGTGVVEVAVKRVQDPTERSHVLFFEGVLRQDAIQMAKENVWRLQDGFADRAEGRSPAFGLSSLSLGDILVMRKLSPAGQQVVNDLAQRHGFGADAVAVMLDAVMNGNGSMAQFSHHEFGGSGQWMRGGMIMIGDMFNNTLKGRIDALCSELSTLVTSQPGLIQTGSFQSQSQGGNLGSQQQQSGAGPVGPVSLFVPASGAGPSGNWWPQDLGRPSSTGAQNNVRYAYFLQSHRLAIDLNGSVTVYDTLDHQIGGFSQQQSAGGSLTFSSQHGIVAVASLPVVSISGTAAQQTTPPKPATEPAGTPGTGSADVFAAIERVADLHGKGILSDTEFNAKKAELLSRL